MPPKAKITKAVIMNASIEVIRKYGFENLNARNLAGSLGCSTQPILYNFKTIDEIREAVYGLVDQYHSEYIMSKEGENEDPLLSLGLKYIRFGYEESNLFKFLFQSNKFGGLRIDDLLESADVAPLLGIVMNHLGCNEQEAKEVFIGGFAVVHGLASLIANNAMDYDEKKCVKILVGMFDS